jgi:hypothetical protein
MVKLTRFIAYTLFFIMMLLLFFPKEQLFYAFEKELQKEKILIANEEYTEHLLSLELREAELYYDGMQVAKVASTEITLLALYNSLEASDIELSKVVERFFPPKIATLTLHHTLLEPFVVSGEMQGEFGSARLLLDLKQRRLHISLVPSKLMKQEFSSSLRMFKKEANGEYSYEKAL